LKNKNIGIFTPWCDQGLGIQSRIYKHLMEKMGYNVFIFSTKPYVSTDNTNDLKKSKYEWENSRIYHSPNRRLEVNLLEFDLFVRNFKIRQMIIPEIQYEEIFKFAKYLNDVHNVLVYAIPNVECIRQHELPNFDVFAGVLTNNTTTFNILKSHNVKNLHPLGFHYNVTPKIKIDKINTSKTVHQKIKILHLSGLNGLFRKRTDIIVEIFDKIYNAGIQNFELTVVIQGNFKQQILEKPFISVISRHLSYSDILNLYNTHHISIQISKHEGLGLGFYESCFMNTPVITLDASPHNEIIHHLKNGWLLPCWMEKDKTPENPFGIIKQTQINVKVIQEKIIHILQDVATINLVIKNTKSYLEKIHGLDNFYKNVKNVFERS
jgi:glycosyltransferase involved in cell wall biosynthesis